MLFLPEIGLSACLDREGGLGTFPLLPLTSANGRGGAPVLGPPLELEVARTFDADRGRLAALFEAAVEEEVEPRLGLYFWPGSLA